MQNANVIFQQHTKISRSTIKKLTKCKAICRYGFEVDIVDVVVYEHGMVVTNVPDYYIDEVVDHVVISLALILIKRIQTYGATTKARKWCWKEVNGTIYRPINPAGVRKVPG